MPLWLSYLHTKLNVLLFLFVTIFASAMVQASPVSHVADLSIVKPIMSCQDLINTDLSQIGGQGSALTSAEPGKHNGHQVCVVKGRLAPEIGFEVLLPTASWSQRFLQVGCGGLCGSIALNVGAADGCLPVTNGEFVLAATNMGHSGMGGEFGLDAQKQIDFAYRGVHLTAQASKALIQAYYGQPQQYAYFTGCSDGGREALIEAQRYPQDFDGILAGAPAMNFSVQNSFYHAWQAKANSGKDGKALLHAKDMPILYKAAIAACDANDGLIDELISEPRACNFDPIVTLCQDKQSSACLSAEQVAAARHLYRGPVDEKTGVSLTLGGPQPGSELSWVGVFVPRPGSEMIFSKMIAEGALRYLVFEDNPGKSYQLSDFSFDLATFEQIRVKNQLFNSTNPDLSAFKQAGGKLMLWHGWSDPHISPLNTIHYYESVSQLMGEENVDFMKLYLFPGMYHCDDGTGPNDFDLLTPMMAWVEQGTIPAEIVASHAGNTAKADRPMMGAPERKPMIAAEKADQPMDKGKKTEFAPATMPLEVTSIKRSRPVYPYPFVAAYTGEGDVTQAANFVARKNSSGRLVYPWAGEVFFTRGQQAWCEINENRVECPAMVKQVK